MYTFFRIERVLRRVNSAVCTIRVHSLTSCRMQDLFQNSPHPKETTDPWFRTEPVVAGIAVIEVEVYFA